MPLPTPRKGEASKEFISRCMGNETMRKDFPEQAQRFAVCKSQSQKRSENMQLHRLQQSFLPAQIRYETFGGKKYLVAPVVAIRAGVFNDALNPSDELAASVPSWNGRPLPVNHPKKGDTFVSANSPDVLDSTSIGFFFNARWEDEALKGELWVDIDKAKQLGGEALEALQRLQRGEPLEVSTAYYSYDEEIPGRFRGAAYEQIRRDIKPDHVALLPNGTGACSLQDGCGAPRVNEDEEEKETAMDVNAPPEEVPMGKIRQYVQNLAKLLGIEDSQEEEEVTPETQEEETYSEPETVPTPNEQQTLEATVQEAETENQNQGGDMSRSNELVEALLANTDVEFSAADRSQLEALNEGLLEKLVAQNPTETGEPEPEAQVEAAEQEEAVPEPVAAEANEEIEIEANTREEDPLQVFASGFGFSVQEMQECLQTHIDEQRAHRARLIAVITNHSDCKKEDLEGDTIAKLERLAKAVAPKADYSGRGGVKTVTRSEPNLPPPVLLAKVDNKEVSSA